MEEFKIDNELNALELYQQLLANRATAFPLTRVGPEQLNDNQFNELQSGQRSKKEANEYELPEDQENHLDYRNYYGDGSQGTLAVQVDSGNSTADQGLNFALPKQSEDNKVTVLDGGFNYTSFLGTPLAMPVKINGIQLPNEPLVTITGSKKIVRTSLTGANREGTVQRRGSVKELINVDDYQIKIVGRIVNENDPDRYPEEILAKIRTIYEARRALVIESKLTQIFNISRIAISKLSLPGEAGMLNSQRYEITGFSDEDFETDLITQPQS